MRSYAEVYSLLLLDLDLSDADVLEGVFRSDLEPQEVARRALALSYFKKLAVGIDHSLAASRALEKFRRINGTIAEKFDFQPASWAEAEFFDLFVGIYRDSVSQLEGHEFDYDFMGQHMSVGPGSCQGANNLSKAHKVLDSVLTYSNPALIDLYRAALSNTGLWAEAEMRRSAHFGFKRVEGGHLFFAPKNREISRTCCTEPTLNALVQFAVGKFFEVRLETCFGVSLSTQPDLNRELARLGSLTDDLADSPCTIDLVSASDSISLSLIDFLHAGVNPLLRYAIKASRCEAVVMPDRSIEKLRMVSTMGNGFTFPLMTLLFCCAVKAAYFVCGIRHVKHRRLRTWGVFGDDIIVDRRVYSFLSAMLGKLGFEVNHAKSFSRGSFRESCGHDYYAGTNVRGIYVKTLETPPGVFSALNRLNRWSARHGWALPRTVRYLRSICPDFRVPPHESDDAGIHTPSSLISLKFTKGAFAYKAWRPMNQALEVLEDDNNLAVSDCFGYAVSSGWFRRPDMPIESEGGARFCERPVRLLPRTPPDRPVRYKVVPSLCFSWDHLLPKYEDQQLAWGEMDRFILTDESYHTWLGVMATQVLR